MQQNIIYYLLKQGNKFLNKTVKDKRRFLITVIALILFLLLINKFQKIFFTTLLILLGIASFIHNRYFRYSHYIGFELAMMATVLTSLAYGPAVGAFAGFVTITGGLIVSGYFKHSWFISVLTLPIIGLIVPVFSHLSLPYLGLLMTLIYDAIIIPLYVLTGSRIVPSIIFVITHILFNYWLFKTIAPIVFSLMI